MVSVEDRLKQYAKLHNAGLGVNNENMRMFLSLVFRLGGDDLHHIEQDMIAHFSRRPSTTVIVKEPNHDDETYQFWLQMSDIFDLLISSAFATACRANDQEPSVLYRRALEAKNEEERRSGKYAKRDTAFYKNLAKTVKPDEKVVKEWKKLMWGEMEDPAIDTAISRGMARMMDLRLKKRIIRSYGLADQASKHIFKQTSATITSPIKDFRTLDEKIRQLYRHYAVIEPTTPLHDDVVRAVEHRNRLYLQVVGEGIDDRLSTTLGLIDLDPPSQNSLLPTLRPAYRPVGEDQGVAFFAKPYFSATRHLYGFVGKRDEFCGMRLQARQHQTVGALEIVSRAYENQRGCIVADSTGMGKSGQIGQTLMLLAFLHQTSDTLPIMFQGRNRWHEHVENGDGFETVRLKYCRGVVGTFGTSTSPRPENLPSLIIAPAETVYDLVAELKRRTGDALHIVHIRKASEISSIPPSSVRQTIVVNFDILSNHYLGDRTLFKRRYNIVVTDEAHRARGRGVYAEAVRAINAQASFSIAQTATPIFASVLDLAHLAHLVHIPDAEMVQGAQKDNNLYSLARNHLNNLTATRRADTRASSGAWYTMSGDEMTDRMLCAKGVRVPELEETEADQVPSPLTALVEKFAPFIIRRTPQSKDFDGNPAVKLGELSEEYCVVNYTPRELNHLLLFFTRQNEQAMRQGLADRTNTLRFYGSCYQDAIRAGVSPHSALYGSFPTADQLEDGRLESKLQKMVEIIRNHPEEKVCIHADFNDVIKWIRAALRSVGMSARTISSDIPPSKRLPFIDEINRPEPHSADDGSKTRLVICGPVASVGINLAGCNIVIQLAGVWTPASYQQRIGRHWRTLPNSQQPKNVKVYTIFALNAVDKLLLSAASDRARMDESSPIPSFFGDQYTFDRINDLELPNKSPNGRQIEELERRGISHLATTIYRSKRALFNVTDESEDDPALTAVPALPAVKVVAPPKSMTSEELFAAVKSARTSTADQIVESIRKELDRIWHGLKSNEPLRDDLNRLEAQYRLFVSSGVIPNAFGIPTSDAEVETWLRDESGICKFAPKLYMVDARLALNMGMDSGKL